ncbi:ubiquinone biosynthesis protein [Rhodococcus sp. 05-2255-3B1]|uniref:class I SAM-dependent methyltransferase n=1 Tax=unclassified Rhodococcus (in: high G+C Gram-positive bacteria) TaxID=192944 RepID=UPI000B9AB608|nr:MULTISPECIES: methyltransferase domain-containing protein [unclassified Rhodococcus (in: high G+C Gram-positive bacteria)]OZE10893.1 ubiquinone biosynthesis protein [Rhodococcus sp. 05-2255-3B1]OZE14721.1 ubiquinone biosynthesis protein [Rhodococcus sp. 05-2255-3C]OZE22065.1 ubiquinone biosynthesis protein [Rhodococcus sp. 05-2255-2A2]
MRRPTKYTVSARLYDVISFEWPVYRAGREAAFELLNLPVGSHVLDLGCGTGLNFAGLQRMIGPTGSITGVDASPQMLEQARRRADRFGWSNVTLVAADATALTSADLGEQAPFDAALSTYALSLMTPWQAALEAMIAATRVGGVVAVVDMQRPVGWSAGWTPLAKLACRLGGSDIEAHPWTAMAPLLRDLSTRAVRGGHIQIRVGTVNSGSAEPSS